MSYRALFFLTLAGATFAVRAHADVIVRLQSGAEMRTRHTWTENGLVKFEHRGGVVGFPPAAIVSMTKVDDRDAAASTRTVRSTESAPSAAATAPTAAAVEAPKLTSGADAHRAAEPRGGGIIIDTRVPEVKGEDLETRMERLDGLLVHTHRELSLARTRGEPQEILDALQAKIDEINRQRKATGKELGAIH